MGDCDVPDDVLAMPGYEILQSAQHLARVLGIVLGNATDLQRYFDSLNAPTDPSRLLRLWDANNRDAFDAHLNEAERLLFNFLTACYSRVEFYRTLVNKGLIVGELRTEYDRRVAALDSMPLHRWLSGLRRLMQHHALPVSSGTLTMGHDTGMRTTFTINLELLRRRHADEFRGAARAYMEGRDEQDVLEAVADYLAIVKEFDTWFGDAYVRNHLEAAETFLDARSIAGQEMLRKRLKLAQDAQTDG